MTYEEKLDLILKAIIEAKKASIKGRSVKLYISDDNVLSQIGKDEVRDILYKLEVEEKILSINNIYNRLLPVTEQPKNLGYLLLDFRYNFETWYENYLMKSKTSVQNLDYINMLRVYDIVLDINEQIQLTHKVIVAIHLLPSLVRFSILFPADTIGMRDKYCETRWDSLKYLQEQGIIQEFKHNDAFHRWDTIVTVTLTSLSKFDDFYKTIRDEYIKSNKSNEKTNSEKTDKNTKQAINQLDEEKSEVVYEIIYTKQRQILMNNAQIGKPDFNSENDLVFSFLYAHPNESITTEQIEKAVGSKLNKSLHKIVENLGFEGDTKEVFLSVSKNAIQFRNPITKKDLEEMKKPLIKTIKGGGKLLLPR